MQTKNSETNCYVNTSDHDLDANVFTQNMQKSGESLETKDFGDATMEPQAAAMN